MHRQAQAVGGRGPVGGRGMVRVRVLVKETLTRHATSIDDSHGPDDRRCHADGRPATTIRDDLLKGPDILRARCDCTADFEGRASSNNDPRRATSPDNPRRRLTPTKTAAITTNHNHNIQATKLSTWMAGGATAGIVEVREASGAGCTIIGSISHSVRCAYREGPAEALK